MSESKPKSKSESRPQGPAASARSMPPGSSGVAGARRSPAMSGRKVLIALMVGLVIGGAIGIFMESIVANTPNDIDPHELHWLRRLLAAAGGLSGLAIESIRQLQTSSTDPAYRLRRRLRR